MPLFEYKAVAPNGETVRGTMEAATMDLVVLKLQEAGNIRSFYVIYIALRVGPIFYTVLMNIGHDMM